MTTSTLSTKGQCVIPRKIREYMHLHAGDKLDFIVGEDGEVVVRPVVLDICELKGILKKPTQRALSVQEMNEAVRARAARLP